MEWFILLLVLLWAMWQDTDDAPKDNGGYTPKPPNLQRPEPPPAPPAPPRRNEW